METYGRVPDFVDVGSWRVSPEDFLGTALMVLRHLSREVKVEKVKVVQVVLEPAANISYEGARSPWKWVIFPRDFQAWDLVELARL